MCTLLAENDPSGDLISLPSNKDAATVLSSNSINPTPAYIEETMEVGKYYVTLITEGKVNTWYVASCEGKNSDGTYEMDHLTRVQRGHNLKWKHPARLDKVNLRAESIIECVVDSEWDVSHERNMTFILRNHVYISNFVQKMFI